LWLGCIAKRPDGGGAIHPSSGKSASESPVPITCGPVVLILHAPTLPESMADWRSLMQVFLAVPVPPSVERARGVIVVDAVALPTADRLHGRPTQGTPEHAWN
jgi:hypothetical protein